MGMGFCFSQTHIKEDKLGGLLDVGQPKGDKHLVFGLGPKQALRCLQQTHLKFKGMKRLKVKDMQKGILGKY